MAFWKSFYITNRFFALAAAFVFLFLTAYFFPVLFNISKVLMLVFAAGFLLDLSLLFGLRKPVIAQRSIAEKFSNGDENEVKITIQHRYPLPVGLCVIDELPARFQIRDLQFYLKMKPGQVKVIKYSLRPVKRGEYSFGLINVFATTVIGLVRRRTRVGAEKTVGVYPSFMQMRKYELLAISNQLREYGIKKIRRIGHNMEFEQIKNYVMGDDYRKVNWKATARKSELMVNQYQDERSQQVYAIIDKGRSMQMPFDKMSLLDYAINASLVISNIALKKGDKAGLITFQHKVSSILPASSRNMQLNLILEQLYKQKTAYKETDYAKLYTALKRKVTQRSLILLFTNFESLSSVKRQLDYLRMIGKQHLLVCIFFENTEVMELLNRPGTSLEEVYTKGIAEQLACEKKLIVKELRAHGIHSLLSPPKELSVNTINKYLELKARGLI